MMYSRVTIDPQQMDVLPCIRRLRVPVATVVSMVAAGMTNEEILTPYPDLEPNDIRKALTFAEEAVREHAIPFIILHEIHRC